MQLAGRTLGPEALLAHVEALIAPGDHPQHGQLVLLAGELGSYLEYAREAERRRARIEQMLSVTRL